MAFLQTGKHLELGKLSVGVVGVFDGVGRVSVAHAQWQISMLGWYYLSAQV